MSEVKTPTVAELEADEKANGLVRIYNKSGRTLVHGKYRALANTFCEVPQPLADFWRERFKGDVIGGEEAQRELGGANARLQELQTKLDTALKENASLKAMPKGDRNAALLNEALAKIKGLEAQVADLNEALDKATAPSEKPGAESI